MSTHNIGFYEDLTKIIFELSSNIMKYAPYFFCCICFLGAFKDLMFILLLKSFILITFPNIGHTNKRTVV